MKFIIRPIFAMLFFCAAALPAGAQDDLDQLLNESIDDGRKLISAYVSPFMNSVSLGLNQGWYNTAKPHKIAGIDLTVTANAMTIRPVRAMACDPPRPPLPLDSPCTLHLGNSPAYRGSSSRLGFLWVS